jgi:hypothetical protein
MRSSNRRAFFRDVAGAVGGVFSLPSLSAADQGVWGEGEVTDAAIGGTAIINGVTSSKASAALGQQSVYYGGMRSSLIGRDPMPGTTWFEPV